MRKRVLAGFLCLCMVTTLLPTVALAAGTDTGKAIQLVDSGTAANISGGQADNVYFGTYKQSSNGSDDYKIDPIKWRVLSNSNGELFLLSDQNLDAQRYQDGYNSGVKWDVSTIRSWLNGYDGYQNTGRSNYTRNNFMDAAFSAGEQAAIATTEVVNNANGNIEGGANTSDKLFLLSIEEALRPDYGFSSSAATTGNASGRVSLNTAYAIEQGAYNNNNGAGSWWLRSPGSQDDYAAYVNLDGSLNSSGGNVMYADIAVRPAFHLDLDSVLFTSAAVGGKSSGAVGANALTAVEDYSGNEWKLTLKDSSRNSFNISFTAYTGTIAYIDYTGATVGTNEYISAIVKGSDNTIKYYGRIAQPVAADGTASIDLSSITLEDSDTLYVFSEQYNSDSKTDYASELKEISLTKNAYNVELNVTNLTFDGTPYAMMNESYLATLIPDSGYILPEANTDDLQVQSDGKTLSTAAGEYFLDYRTGELLISQSCIVELVITAKGIAKEPAVSLSAAELDFGTVLEGYAKPETQTVKVKNVGNQSVTLTQPAAKYYTIGTLPTYSISPGETTTFTIQPRAGLATGTYNETLTISGNHGISQSVQLSFSVLSTDRQSMMLGVPQLYGVQVDRVYLGTYPQSSVNNGNYNTEPVKWRVLSNEDGKLFLLSNQNLDVKPYNVLFKSVTWENCTLRSWLNGYAAINNIDGVDYESDNFIDTAFSSEEQAAIATTEVVNEDGTFGSEGGNDTEDKIFLISLSEIKNRMNGFTTHYSSFQSTNTAYVAGKLDKDEGDNSENLPGFWWLRSPGDFNNWAALVGEDGILYDVGGMVNYNDVTVRPAFHVDLNAILFSSAAVGGKTGDGVLTAVSDYSGNEWKLTLLDKNRNFTISDIETSASTVSFSYSGAQTGTSEYISAVLIKNNVLTHYGRILQLDGTTNGESGTVSLTLPAGVTLGNDTKLYVFNEQYNGGANDDTRLTDYSSEMIEVQPAVDTTIPSLSNGSATRTSATTATVKFTSNEAGTCYYIAQDTEITLTNAEIVSNGKQQPCKAGENTIALNDITASAQYVAVVAKDAAGNVSQPLKITIPDYSTPVYQISLDTTLLNFGSKTVGYTEAPAVQTVTITNTGNQNVTVDLPASTNYAITAGTGFTSGGATLSPGGKAQFTVQPKTGLGVGSYPETLAISGSDSTSASVTLSFEVLDTYTLTVNLNGGSGTTTGGEYLVGEVVNIDAGSRSNYRFSGWTSSNGGIFADASSASTTFTMPAADTTITAHWEHTGSSGGGGGTSGGGSGGVSTYSITAKETVHGTVTVSPQKAAPGSTVTVTAVPEQGYMLDILTVTDSKDGDVKLTDHGEGKFTFTMPAGPVTVEAVFAEIPPEPAQPLPFADVDKTAWYYDGVAYVYEHSLMTGTSATTFAPETTTSRAMIATILWRMAGSPVVNYAMSYTDVDQGQWYSEAVRWATSEGIVGGYGNGTFGTNDPITREQFATMLYRYARQQGYDVSVGENTNILSYTDVGDLAEYAIPAMQWAVGAGIINGTGDGSTLSPQGQATRAQAAVMLMRFCENYVTW